ncbi:hypothetical protein J8F10_31820 [Gemmata sp. G18]|uniref:Uncharacterized protein n=1 Tax=Gemmata palustris TaxID=2822762 RepID=A0ABS5C1J9_9BACT|nr:hypothetical protein [Gemmata palustris]MBP3959860.1 hypothetical protein [Gemmata palustris]
MSTVPPAIHDLARRLIALEAARPESPGAPLGGAVRVCDRLRTALARLAGVAGFRSLLSRALALATAEAPELAAARVRTDGALEGLEGFPYDHDTGAGVAIVTHLLGLLVTFIGEPLTLRLVRDAWPDAPVTGADAGSGGQP